jgi:hypothetical protein
LAPELEFFFHSAWLGSPFWFQAKYAVPLFQSWKKLFLFNLCVENSPVTSHEKASDPMNV